MQSITGFSDASKWVIKDGEVLYVPQDKSYKEVLLGGTPIKYFIEGQIPEFVIGERRINVRLPKIKEKAVEPQSSVRDFWDDEDFVIHQGGWVNMTKKELIKYSWFSDAFNTPEYGQVVRESTLVVNNTSAYNLNDMSEAGGMYNSRDQVIYYIQKATTKPNRLRIVSVCYQNGKCIQSLTDTIYSTQISYWFGGIDYRDNPLQYFFDKTGKAWGLPEGSY
jgi:hypothetical protein